VDSIKKLNRYLRDYKGIILLGALFLTASNFFLIWIPVLIRRTMDEVELLVDERLRKEYQSSIEMYFFPVKQVFLAFNSLLLIGTVLHVRYPSFCHQADPDCQLPEN
jgi:ATP-binding cassette, subfamily B, multidrug efflux pump